MGWVNADNRYGVTSFVVGTVLGDGVNYTSIQTAINDAGAGPVDIYIRPGVYTENLSFSGNVYLIAASMSGETSPPVGVAAHVNIVGDHNITQNALTVCKGIYFNSVATAFTIEDAATGGVASLELENCTVVCSTAFVLGGATGNGQLKLLDCDVFSSGRTLLVNTVSIGGFYEIMNSHLESSGDGVVYVDSAVSTGVVRDSSLVGAGASSFLFDTNSAGATLDIQNSYLQSPGVACITFQAAATVTAYHNTYNPLGNSEYITGPGNYAYGDDVIVGGKLSSGIDNAAVQTIAGWRPWAEADVNGSTVIRGTCAFDSNQFTVVEGFVSFAGTVPLLSWGEINISATIADNSGYFALSTITLTLPPTPLLGFTNMFKNGPGLVTVAANAGQTLKVGNQSGSQAASTLDGDAIQFTYQASTSTWIANSVIGNWLVT